MDIQVGDQAVDYAQVAQKEKLSDLQLRIRQLVEQVEQITKEQSYQRVSTVSVTLMENPIRKVSSANILTMFKLESLTYSHSYYY